VTLAEGHKAPDFDLPADGGGRVRLQDQAGAPLVLYFYPKDDTPGCTKEAQAFAEAYGEFKVLGAEVIGISKDPAHSHDRFKAAYRLPFPLGSDEDATVIEAYGSWVEKSRYGKSYMGTDRSTFLIDRDGTIRKAWRKVEVPGHVDEVMAALKEIA
jgi:peroxiredoxin Q/BCP